MNEKEITHFFRGLKTDEEWYQIIEKILKGHSLKLPLINPFNSPEEFFEFLNDVFERNDLELKWILHNHLFIYYRSINEGANYKEEIYSLLWVISSLRPKNKSLLQFLEKQFLEHRLVGLDGYELHTFLLSVISDFVQFGLIEKENVKSYLLKNEISDLSFQQASLRYFIDNEDYSDFFIQVEEIIPDCLDIEVVEVIISSILEICFVNNSYWTLFKWIKDSWYKLEEQFPKQLNLIRIELMKYLNYENENFSEDKYILPVLAIINSKHNQLPAIVIKDLLSLKLTEFLEETFSLEKCISFHKEKISVFEELNALLISYDKESEEANSISELFKISLNSTFCCILSNEEISSLEEIVHRVEVVKIKEMEMVA